MEEAEEWRGKLIEEVAAVDDTLLARYLEDHESITADEIRDALRKTAIAGIAIPVICGSAFKNKGVQALLDAVIDYLPSPVDKGSVTGIDPRNDEEVTREPDDEAPMAALAFKIATDPFVGRLVFLRVYSGTLKAGDTVTEYQDYEERTYQSPLPDACKQTEPEREYFSRRYMCRCWF